MYVKLRQVKDGRVLRVSLPFKDQTSHELMRLEGKCAISTTRLALPYNQPKEIKLPIVNQQCVVYLFSCDLCDEDYVGYTARHLHQRIAEHKNSAIGKHLLEVHGDISLLNESQFRILRKCQGKFDCLVYEMLCIWSTLEKKCLRRARFL